MNESGFGLWAVVVLNSALFILFAVSFMHPKSRRDWHAMGAFSAFIVALFTEMYGFPLTIYLLSGWLGSRFPALKVTHGGGHLWSDLIGWKGDPHLSPFHLGSYVFIAAGFWMIASAWKVLWAAQRVRGLARTGPYSFLRHPQYAGFLLIVIGFLLQWPTIPTLLMFPVLVVVYRRLAIAEERELLAEFGEVMEGYTQAIPRFIPRHLDRTGSRNGGDPVDPDLAARQAGRRREP